MADQTQRSVRIERTAPRQYVARNPRGGTITFGGTDAAEFTPVELLLAAIGGCTGTDTDVATTRHAEPTRFAITVTGDKIHDESGNRMTNLVVSFDVAFPDGAAGDAARAILPRAVRLSHDRLCTVSRTVEWGTAVSTEVNTL
jgi:putative redox protein